MQRFLSPRNLYPLVVVALVISLGACTTLRSINPFENAHNVPLKALASYGTYVVGVETAAKLKQDPSIPRELVDKLAALERDAGPVADGLYDAAVEVLVIKQQLAAGATTEERLAIASAELDGWVASAVPKMNKFFAAVNGD